MSAATPEDVPKRRKLVGYENFVRSNPKSDFFTSSSFAHVEFFCQDATNVSKRFGYALGMKLIGKSDLSTGNSVYASYVYQSNDVVFIFTAPYLVLKTTAAVAESPVKDVGASFNPHPTYDPVFATAFTAQHGLAARAIALHVTDATEAYHTSVSKGALSVTPPAMLVDTVTGTSMTLSEVKLYGDVVLRYVSGNYAGPGYPNYVVVNEGPTAEELSLGIARLDHCVGNVPDLMAAVNYICDFTGFHQFAEFTAEDIGTIDSGLNSMVLANNNEMVLLPINEPTFGTKRKSQIQTYLEQNDGAGLQHMALKTNDIFHTLTEMRKRSYLGGFDFMPKPSEGYYKSLQDKIGTDVLTPLQFQQFEALGLLVDKDEAGILIQIFTKPLGDRPTMFIEIIERVGCMTEFSGRLTQAAGCGGFGKGNFSELFKSIEKYEETLAV